MKLLPPFYFERIVGTIVPEVVYHHPFFHPDVTQSFFVFCFLFFVQGKLNLPLVWMPRSICMNKAGRRDLVNAITRAGGYDSVVQRAGYVTNI